MKKIMQIFFIFFSCLIFSSELRIYSDNSVYYPDKPNSFIGFNGNVEVFCDNYKLSVYRKYEAKGNSPLLKLFDTYLNLSDKLHLIGEQEVLIGKMIDSLRFSSNESVSKFLKNSGEYAIKIAELKRKKQLLKNELDIVKIRISEMAPSVFPFYCDFPKGFKSVRYEFKGITYRVLNKLYIDSSSGKVDVVKEISLKNKSGIDIVADSILILNIASSRYFSPISFSPWIVRERDFRTSAPLKTKKMSKGMFDVAASMPVSPQEVSQLESRVYLLGRTTLFSDGIEKRFKVKSKKVPYSKQLVVYPYIDKNVYNEYSFSLPFEVDSDYWEVFVGKKVFSRVRGVFEKQQNRYKIFAGIDYSVEVSRKRKLNFQEEKGLFSKKNVLKDGYEITLRNVSDKIKRVNVVDRVPVSVKEGVIIRDVKVNGVSNYNIDKKGKLAFKVELKPGEAKNIDVSFVIEFPEGKDIVY